MLTLVVDIGNTNIVVGGFSNSVLQFEYRLQSELKRTPDEYKANFLYLLNDKLGSNYSIDGAIICSVVPALTEVIHKLIKQTFGVEALEVGPGIKTSVQVKVADPTQVGADRIANSLAVRTKYGKNSVVVDFGTATTFDYVNRDGAYEGGIICPGLIVSLNSLVANTAKLPQIELTWPGQIIGKNTIQAMQVGSLVGYVCMIDGLLTQIESEVGKLDHIVSTGGLGEVVTKYSKKNIIFDPSLTLFGINLVYELNRVHTKNKK